MSRADRVGCSAPRAWVEFLRDSARELLDADPFDLTLRLTLITLVLKPVGFWYHQVPILILSVWALLSQRARFSPLPWLGMLLAAGHRVAQNYVHVENHGFLLCYWLLAVFIAVSLNHSRAVLVLNGRLLVGLVFAFAVLWKLVLSPDFVDGTFFRSVLLLDSRFEELSILAGGMTPEMIDANQKTIDQLSSQSVAFVDFKESPRLDILVNFLTWWTLSIEGLLALAFLWPVEKGVSRARDALLLVFTWTTYLFATVSGFAWTLMVLGFAQCDLDHRKTRLAYLLTIGLIAVYKQVPWAAWLVERLGS